MKTGASAMLLAALATLGPALAEDAPDPLACTGPFAKDTDEAALVKAFGRENVVAATLEGAEGASERGTVVYPKDPARRIEITWHDVKRRRRPASIALKDRSAWRVAAPGGSTLALGAGLAAVEAVNGRPFAISGFGWDYGGFATDWKGGALAKPQGGCALSLRFDPDPKARQAALDKASGEGAFVSSGAAMKAVRPRVSEISLGWPE